LQSRIRIGLSFEPLMAIIAHFIDVAGEILFEGFAIVLAGLLIADRVDLEMELLEAEHRKALHRHDDAFGIDPGAVLAEALDAELVELPIAA
jgi:hypothetical protein